MYRARTRTTYAASHRTSGHRSGAMIYPTQPGEGIRHQTISGTQYGFDGALVVCAQASDGSVRYAAQSEHFPDRYYTLYRQPGGTWFFSGDEQIAGRYIGMVKAFIAATSTSA